MQTDTTARGLRWTVLDMDASTVTLHGHEAPRHFTARLEHPSWDVPVHLRVTVDPDRGPIASGIGNQDGDQTDVPSYHELHKLLGQVIELPRLLRNLTADAVGGLHYRRMRDDLALVDDDLSADQWRDRLASIESAASTTAESAFPSARPRRRRLLTREYLAQVADIYRAALDEGRPPTEAVKASFSVSHSTAAKHVRKARDQGLLGPADSTRPGEKDGSR